MKITSSLLPITIFLVILGVSLGLVLFPEVLYLLMLMFIESFRFGGLPLLFAVMIIQALVIPIPSEFILICGGAAFGVLPSWLVGTFGSLAAASISFYVSRKGGRSVAIRFVNEKGIRFADNWFNRWGIWAVLLGRFAPFIPFDVISYSAGLTQMKFKSFMVPTVIGTFPRVLFYTFLGDFFGVTITELVRQYPNIPPDLEQTILMFNFSLLAVVGAIAAILVVYWLITQRYAATTR